MSITQTFRRATALLGVAALSAIVVGPTTAGASTGAKALDGIPTKLARQAVTTYAELVLASYEASLASATDMKGAIDAFVAEPTQANLDIAKEAWLTARDDYNPTEAFRFYDGPIDNPKNGPEGQINAWPLDEAYLDYVEGDAEAGIINNTTEYPEITVDVLVESNEQGGETNISTGWHAIEFLLWGQDLVEGQPGQRPLTDYTSSPTAERRGQYLTLATDLLISDLTSMRDAWESDAKYRKSFVKKPAASVAKILRGVGALSAGELAGERMAVAYETKDQEDEHSCFSDNTNADVFGDEIGIKRVYLAEFPDGSTGETSISDLVAEVAPKLDADMRAQIDQSVADIEAYPAPFEELIVGDDDAPGRVALLTSIESLEEQGELLARIAKKLGVKITLEV